MRSRLKFFKRLDKAVQLKGGMISWEDFKKMLGAFQMEQGKEGGERIAPSLEYIKNKIDQGIGDLIEAKNRITKITEV